MMMIMVSFGVFSPQVHFLKMLSFSVFTSSPVFYFEDAPESPPPSYESVCVVANENNHRVPPLENGHRVPPPDNYYVHPMQYHRCYCCSESSGWVSNVTNAEFMLCFRSERP
ncbi:uncharacterized protein LOC135388778 [Ornithodoros turicata]|uniref:uncharacterized protein LOC135388778 n=1 Tax=Ornithodoros turicata TaxID=34597 RepID=UPI0031387428